MYIWSKTSPKTKKASAQIVASYRNTLKHQEGGESYRIWIRAAMASISTLLK